MEEFCHDRRSAGQLPPCHHYVSCYFNMTEVDIWRCVKIFRHWKFSREITGGHWRSKAFDKKVSKKYGEYSKKDAEWFVEMHFSLLLMFKSVGEYTSYSGRPISIFSYQPIPIWQLHSRPIPIYRKVLNFTIFLIF